MNPLRCEASSIAGVKVAAPLTAKVLVRRRQIQGFLEDPNKLLQMILPRKAIVAVRRPGERWWPRIRRRLWRSGGATGGRSGLTAVTAQAPGETLGKQAVAAVRRRWAGGGGKLALELVVGLGGGGAGGPGGGRRWWRRRCGWWSRSWRSWRRYWSGGGSHGAGTGGGSGGTGRLAVARAALEVALCV